MRIFFTGDIYLIGCTNAGKSTLFNLLIKSDLCKTKAINVVQRATTSNWPGTTLNLLKVFNWTDIINDLLPALV